MKTLTPAQSRVLSQLRSFNGWVRGDAEFNGRGERVLENLVALGVVEKELRRRTPDQCLCGYGANVPVAYYRSI